MDTQPVDVQNQDSPQVALSPFYLSPAFALVGKLKLQVPGDFVFDLSHIPQGYNHLFFIARLQVASASFSNPALQFNTDIGTHYDSESFEWWDLDGDGFDGVVNTDYGGTVDNHGVALGAVPGYNAATADHIENFGVATGWIPFFRSDNSRKLVICTNGFALQPTDPSVLAVANAEALMGFWDMIDPIGTLRCYDLLSAEGVGGAHFNADSSFTLFTIL